MAAHLALVVARPPAGAVVAADAKPQGPVRADPPRGPPGGVLDVAALRDRQAVQFGLDLEHAVRATGVADGARVEAALAPGHGQEDLGRYVFLNSDAADGAGDGEHAAGRQGSRILWFWKRIDQETRWATQIRHATLRAFTALERDAGNQ